MRRLIGGATALAVVGVCWLGAGPASAAESGSRTACGTSPAAGHGKNPFRHICRYLDERQGVVQVALFDKLNHKTYRLSNGDNTQYTASIVKVDVLARWLRQFERQGIAIPNDMPYSIKYLMERMIEFSDNAATTGLFYFGGGCKSLTRFNELIPLNETEVACQTPNYYGWGNTTTTAADQVKLMKVFAYDEPSDVLGSDARAYGLHLMQNIDPPQRFGISCGPWGTSCAPPKYAQPVAGVTVALKNGWKTLPTCPEPPETLYKCPWQVNSTGWVKGDGRDYVLTVLTTENPTGTEEHPLIGYDYGIDTIQGVSKRVWANLG